MRAVCAGGARGRPDASAPGRALARLGRPNPACRVNIDAEARAAAECEGHASADVGASCTGACHGRCDGTCSGKAGTGGNSAQCNGECKGSCRGECEGHARVNASAQCRASASVKANADARCTEPELAVEASARAELDKSRAEMVIRALKNGLPRALSIQAHLEPLKDAVAIWVQSAQELKDMVAKLLNSFRDQAICISGQLAAAANLIGKINANVSCRSRSMSRSRPARPPAAPPVPEAPILPRCRPGAGPAPARCRRCAVIAIRTPGARGPFGVASLP